MFELLSPLLLILSLLLVPSAVALCISSDFLNLYPRDDLQLLSTEGFPTALFEGISTEDDNEILSIVTNEFDEDMEGGDGNKRSSSIATVGGASS